MKLFRTRSHNVSKAGLPRARRGYNIVLTAKTNKRAFEMMTNYVGYQCESLATFMKYTSVDSTTDETEERIWYSEDTGRFDREMTELKFKEKKG